jgi:hypothetical protein
MLHGMFILRVIYRTFEFQKKEAGNYQKISGNFQYSRKYQQKAIIVTNFSL